MKPVLRLLLLLTSAFVIIVRPAHADGDMSSPIGLWRTIDDQSGKPRALVRIAESNGVLVGTIVKTFPEPGEDPAPRCTKCTDARRDQPVIGMTFLSGLKKEADGLVWSGGEILDPDSGSVYRSKITLTDGGKRLDVRGYIGMPLLGRTQVWLRADDMK